MSVEFVDADAHVVEGQALIGECLRRWPDAFAFSERGELLTEGRRYPEPEGPGAGCPPEHGLSTALGINATNHVVGGCYINSLYSHGCRYVEGVGFRLDVGQLLRVREHRRMSRLEQIGLDAEAIARDPRRPGG